MGAKAKKKGFSQRGKTRGKDERGGRKTRMRREARRTLKSLGRSEMSLEDSDSSDRESEDDGHDPYVESRVDLLGENKSGERKKERKKEPNGSQRVSSKERRNERREGEEEATYSQGAMKKNSRMLKGAG